MIVRSRMMKRGSTVEERSKELVRRSCDLFWNAHDLKTVEEFYEAHYRGHDPGGIYEGNLSHLKLSAQAVFDAMPDLHIEINDLIAEGEKVVKYWTATGTHRGEFMGVPASGNAIHVTGVTIYRVADGKFAEAWWNIDSYTMLQQMGAIPSAK